MLKKKIETFFKNFVEKKKEEVSQVFGSDYSFDDGDDETEDNDDYDRNKEENGDKDNDDGNEEREKDDEEGDNKVDQEDKEGENKEDNEGKEDNEDEEDRKDVEIENDEDDGRELSYDVDFGNPGIFNLCALCRFILVIKLSKNLINCVVNFGIKQ